MKTYLLEFKYRFSQTKATSTLYKKLYVSLIVDGKNVASCYLNNIVDARCCVVADWIKQQFSNELLMMSRKTKREYAALEFMRTRKRYERSSFVALDKATIADDNYNVVLVKPIDINSLFDLLRKLGALVEHYKVNNKYLVKFS